MSGYRLRWTGNPNVIVLKTTSGAAPNTAPVAGVTYTAGQTLGNAVVLAAGSIPARSVLDGPRGYGVVTRDYAIYPLGRGTDRVSGQPLRLAVRETAPEPTQPVAYAGGYALYPEPATSSTLQIATISRAPAGVLAATFTVTARIWFARPSASFSGYGGSDTNGGILSVSAKRNVEGARAVWIAVQSYNAGDNTITLKVAATNGYIAGSFTVNLFEWTLLSFVIAGNQIIIRRNGVLVASYSASSMQYNGNSGCWVGRYIDWSGAPPPAATCQYWIDDVTYDDGVSSTSDGWETGFGVWTHNTAIQRVAL